MTRFSERMGFKPIRDAIQMGLIDNALRTSLWNVFLTHYGSLDDELDSLFPLVHQPRYKIVVQLWTRHLYWPLDTLGESWHSVEYEFKKHFFSCEWYEVYDFIEFVGQYSIEADQGGYQGNAKRKNKPLTSAFVTDCNSLLEEHLSGYRFVGAFIAPITSEQEITAIERAINTAKSSEPLHAVTTHVQQALALLSDRQTPDYRNSMKESITSVEALCKLIADDDKATLGRALTQIENRHIVPLHPQLKAAFQSLYNYTNDAEGIRHALKDESRLELEDAIFMLVTCSAFVNYMVEKARKAGIAL